MRLSRVSYLVVALACSVACSVADAQGGRTTVRMLASHPPGGDVDILARIFAEKLSESIARPVVVENRSGMVGQIAAETLKAALPNGNTLMVAPASAILLRPQTLKTPPFDPLADFAPVAHAGTGAVALGISASVPAKDLREFVSWAKANPGSASFGSGGAGGLTHFVGLMIGQAIGVELRHVPYKGSGPAAMDTAAGHIPATVQPLGSLMAQARAGRIRILAISSSKRTLIDPGIPTFGELGYPSLQVENWYGIFAPAGTPPETVNRLNGVFVLAMRTAAIRDKMRSLDLDIRELNVAEFASVVKADYERWGSIIKTFGFRDESQ